MAWPFEKKTYPEYWETYQSYFDKKKAITLEYSRFVVLDTETTGFDYELDRLLSIGAVSISKNEIAVIDSFEIYIKQERFNPNTVQIHGIIKHTKTNCLSEEQAMIQFLEYIKDAVLVAHHAVFDIKMINCALERLGLPKLKNKVLDTMDLYAKTRIKSNFISPNKNYSLDEIAETYAINLADRHTAAGDALITALVFLKTISLLNKSNTLKLNAFMLPRN